MGNAKPGQDQIDNANTRRTSTSDGVGGTTRKRRRQASSPPSNGETMEDIHLTSIPQEAGMVVAEGHRQKVARNFDRVHFGEWQIKTWYFSPYPVVEWEIDDNTSSSSPFPASSSNSSPVKRGAAPGPGPKTAGPSRPTPRSHGRTSDLLAGSLGRQNLGPDGELANLWVCDMCFKYMVDGSNWEMHKKQCTLKRPPGHKVYQRGAHTVWEVDGAKEKLYCQNLSLFGKLFIDVKTLFFDCDNFLFYILTDASSQADHMIGFFSKEKYSFDNYNLACIITLPPYQRQGYGMLMIEFSYELSRRTGKVGTPERPLSDLGLRSYLAYWTSTLIRFFRHVLSALPLDTPKQTITTRGNFPDVLNGYRSPSSMSSSGQEDADSSTSMSARKKKRAVGWDGEHYTSRDDAINVAKNGPVDDPQFSSLRTFTTTIREDGGAETHVSVQCSLADIARATNLRIEDAAFALNECGLLAKRITARELEQQREGEEEYRERSSSTAVIMPGMGAGIMGVKAEDVIVLTRQMVEEVAAERKVKKPCMDINFVLL
ncbi:hypothetical protein AMATHDRAFT_6029 [Amanita thiersii Skay4041]|uniref:histone acetyltransferase n=1 Tax=Amanita thiersii Skay4041 TaxID=703135 RepID=A0A2A9NB22_9AGAR|nr:hypothetical protein AMATHDRAFT_6029 [Amanita thiersii Skay4041]